MHHPVLGQRDSGQGRQFLPDQQLGGGVMSYTVMSCQACGVSKLCRPRLIADYDMWIWRCRHCDTIATYLDKVEGKGKVEDKVEGKGKVEGKETKGKDKGQETKGKGKGEASSVRYNKGKVEGKGYNKGKGKGKDEQQDDVTNRVD